MKPSGASGWGPTPINPTASGTSRWFADDHANDNDDDDNDNDYDEDHVKLAGRSHNTTDAPQLKPHTQVWALEGIEGVPPGTAGRVTIVNGFSWIRDRVRFDNGYEVGSIDRQYLSTEPPPPAA